MATSHVYRTPAVVRTEPCGACVHDASRPQDRTGYPDCCNPMMMCCSVCGARWIDPTLDQRARETRDVIDKLNEQMDAVTLVTQHLIDKQEQFQRTVRLIAIGLIVVGYAIVAHRIFFP